MIKIYYFKYKDNNYYNKNYSMNSHVLTGTRIKELTKFVTFDSESTTKYYHNDKQITSKEYNNIYDDKKHKIFNLKLISACFINNLKIKNKIYIVKPSIYTRKNLNFLTKKHDKEINITVKIVYFENENDLIKEFYNDIEKFCSKKSENIRVFCHNAKHDWLQTKLFMVHQFKNWQLKNFRFSIPRFTTYSLPNKKQLTFLDTVNYFQSKLEDLGEEVGILKRGETVDFSKEIRVDQIFLEYSMIDSLILAYKMIQFNELCRGKGSIGFGIASTAYNIWRTSYLDDKIWLHKNKCLTKIERMAYFGGRTECFKLGHFKNVCGIDINSQYPFQMTKPLPISYIKSLRARNKNDTEILKRKYMELKDKYCLIVECSVNSDLKIPVTPHKHNNKLMFINGKKSCVLCSPEIDLLIELDQEVIISGIHFYRKGFPFKKFAKEFYNNKQKNKKLDNLSLERFFKIILNASYGKTGEREIEEITRGCDPDFIGKIVTVENKKEYHFNCLGGLMKASKFLDNDAKNAFCAIASFITSYARSYLYEAFLKLGEENILYCDTDSIYTTLSKKEIDKLLPINDYKLGSWSYDHIDIDMLIYGVKDYQILKNNKTVKKKLKGINLKTAIEVNDNEWLCERWTTLNHGVKISNIQNQMIINQTKVLTREYTKAMKINPIEKEIIIDGKNQKYIQSDLRHFRHDQLTNK